MGMLNGVRTLNALTGGVMSSAQLTTHLATGTNLGSFIQVLNSDSQARVLVESTTAMNAVAGSTLAMNALVASSVSRPLMVATPGFVDIVTASAAAMTSIAESADTMRLMAASTQPKLAMYNSDIALAKIAASTTALTAMRASPQYGVFSTTGGISANPISGLISSGLYIFVGASTLNAVNGVSGIVSTRKAGSAVSMTVASDGTGFAGTALKLPIALPVITPFTFTQSVGTATNWYFGAVRCDI